MCLWGFEWEKKEVVKKKEQGKKGCYCKPLGLLEGWKRATKTCLAVAFAFITAVLWNMKGEWLRWMKKAIFKLICEFESDWTYAWIWVYRLLFWQQFLVIECRCDPLFNQTYIKTKKIKGLLSVGLVSTCICYREAEHLTLDALNWWVMTQKWVGV